MGGGGGGGEGAAIDPYGPLTGQVIVAMKESCRKAMVAPTCSSRLVEPMLLCQVQCAQEFMGKMYNVLGQRKATILKEDLWEGTDLFQIEASLPASEAFGLADSLRKQTSGAASNPQLVFSHWETLEQVRFQYNWYTIGYQIPIFSM